MAPLFSPGTDSLLRAALAALLGVPVASMGLLMLLAHTPLANGAQEPRPQPVPFDHRHHVGDEGIDCRYCHELAWRSATAGVPPTSRCMGCHAQIWSDSAKLEPVRASWFEDTPLAWNRVYALPGFVYFNHSIHVNKGVGCVTCHGRVDTMPAVYQAQPLTMGWCLDCHRAPARHLRPLAEVGNLTWRAPGDAEALGQRLARELDVRPSTDCTTCHR
ncbi:cytochrome c3 family protein [Myxococcaceae bacterium GXIMD 01537]